MTKDNTETNNFSDTDIKLKSVPLYEQEFTIHFMRDEAFASIYSSDTTMITKLDKLCMSNPEMYVLLQDTGTGKRYRLNDKSLVSLRSKKRTVTDEQKQKAGDRMREYQAKRTAQASSMLPD